MAKDDGLLFGPSEETEIARRRYFSNKFENSLPPIPEIICLCGSTRFYQEFQEYNYRFTLQGKIVLSVGSYGNAPDTWKGGITGLTTEQKTKADELHLRKIDLADKVFFLNVGGYMGTSTKRELAYAIYTHKKIEFLEEREGEAFMDRNAHEIAQLGLPFFHYATRAPTGK